MKATGQGQRSRKTEGAWDVDSIINPPSSPAGLIYDPSGKEKNFPHLGEAPLSLVFVICNQSN